MTFHFCSFICNSHWKLTHFYNLTYHRLCVQCWWSVSFCWMTTLHSGLLSNPSCLSIAIWTNIKSFIWQRKLLELPAQWPNKLTLHLQQQHPWLLVLGQLNYRHCSSYTKEVIRHIPRSSLAPKLPENTAVWIKISSKVTGSTLLPSSLTLSQLILLCHAYMLFKPRCLWKNNSSTYLNVHCNAGRSEV